MRAHYAKIFFGLFLHFLAFHAPAQEWWCDEYFCVSPPSPPGWISGPTYSSTGSYVISWQGESQVYWPPYILEESINGGAWVTTEVLENHRSFSAKPNGTYAYRVSVCELWCSEPTSPHVVTVDLGPTVPATPSGSITPMSGNTNTTGSYTVSWSQPTGWEYFLIREHNGAAWSNWENVNVSSRAYTRANGTYHYQARACNAAGCSSESNAVYVIVNAPPTPPTGLSISPLYPDVSYTGDFTINWNLAPGATDRYEVVWHDWFNQAYVILATVPATTTTAAIHVSSPSARGGNNFYVRSCTSSVCSELSAAISGYYSPMENLEAPQPIQVASSAGNMAFTAGVGEAGDARIQIPIEVSPGVNGFSPDLALTYSSGATRSDQDSRRIEGYLGYGWTVTGLSKIRGCPNGGAHSQVINTCLDNELLVQVSTVPGAHTEYRLERAPGVRVFERQLPGYTWWEVFYPDGSIGRYGELGVGDFGVFSSTRYLTTLRDKFGNEQKFTYHLPIEGGMYLTKITYGGSEVSFSYQLREDASSYLRKVALNHIAVRANGATVRSYRIENVKSGPGATDPLRLERVQMCAYEEGGYGEQCLAPMAVTWMQLAGAPPGYGDAVASVSDGTGVRTQFDYALLSATGAHGYGYAEQPFGSVISDPAAQSHPFNVATPVVTEMRSADGLGGWRRTSYAYKGVALFNASYRGLIGFAERRIIEHQVPDYTSSGSLVYRDITTYRQYRLAFPNSGQVTQRLTVVNSDLTNLSNRISHQETLYAHSALFNGQVLAPFVARDMVRKYESGAVVSANMTTQSLCYRALSGDTCPSGGTLLEFPTQRTIKQYAANNLTSATFTPTYWGHVPAREPSGTLSAVTSVVNLANDPDAWIMGFPAKITATSSAAGAPTVTRTETRSRYGATSAVGGVISLPGSEHELRTTLDYDSAGNLASVMLSGPSFQTQTSTFSSFIDSRYPQYVTNAEAQQTALDFDRRFGTPRAVTDPNYRTDLIERDPFGRITKVSDAAGTETRQFYEACVSSVCTQHGAVLLVIRSAGNGSTQVSPTERIYLDALGREVLREVEAFSAADGFVRIETHYDSRGRLIRQSTPYFSSAGASAYSQFYHDVRGRIVRETRPDGGVVRTSYTGSSGALAITRTEDVIDPISNGTRVKRSVFNARGLMTSTTDAYGQSGAVAMNYAYDAFGKLAKVTVGGVEISSAQYNAAGYRESMTEVNTGTTTFVSDALGRVRSQTDARGMMTIFNYDRLNRTTSRVDAYGTGAAVTNTWDWDAPNAIGALEYRQSPGFRENYTYDGLGRLTSQSSIISVAGFPANGTYTTLFGYDGANRLGSVTYSGHGAFTRHYTARGYLSETRLGSSVLERINQRDAFGRPEVVQFGNALSTQYEHDAVGRLTRIMTGTTGAPRVTQDLEYAWRSNDILRLRRDRNNGAATWTEFFDYDNLDRLTSATTSGGPMRTLGFTYDTFGFGNLLTKTSTVGGDLNVTNHSDGSPHRLSGATIAGIYTSFAYDLAGNIVQYTPSSGPLTQIGYDGAGQVKAITVGAPSNPTARDEFWYAPDGDRFLKRTTWQEDGSTRTGWALYLLGGAFEQSHIVGDTAVVYRSEVQVTNMVVHRRTQSVSGGATTAIEYRHRDHLGSLDVTTNAAGAIVRALAFDPFGGRRNADWSSDLSSPSLNALLAASPSPVQRGFTDHEHLDRTGFIHMNGRVFDPRIGRFIQPDPIVQAPSFSQSYNRYAYTFNSPLSLTDPSGYQSVDTMPGDNYNSCDPRDQCLVLDLWTERTWRAPVFEASGVEIAGQIAYDNWSTSIVPWFKGPESSRSAGGGFDAPGGAERQFGAHEAAELLWPGYDLGTCISSRGDCHVGDWILGGVGVIPGGKGAALGAKGLIKAARGTAATRSVSVLGHASDGYVSVAKTLGARHFSVPDKVWNAMTPAQQWAANAKFLDRLVARGDEVVLATQASAARAGSFFARELEYLSGRGYTLSADGWRMLPPVP